MIFTVVFSIYLLAAKSLSDFKTNLKEVLDNFLLSHLKYLSDCRTNPDTCTTGSSTKLMEQKQVECCFCSVCFLMTLINVDKII